MSQKTEPIVIKKKARGRPIGSKNKPKPKDEIKPRKHNMIVQTPEEVAQRRIEINQKHRKPIQIANFVRKFNSFPEDMQKLILEQITA